MHSHDNYNYMENNIFVNTSTRVGASAPLVTTVKFSTLRDLKVSNFIIIHARNNAIGFDLERTRVSTVIAF